MGHKQVKKFFWVKMIFVKIFLTEIVLGSKGRVVRVGVEIVGLGGGGSKSFSCQTVEFQLG